MAENCQKTAKNGLKTPKNVKKWPKNAKLDYIVKNGVSGLSITSVRHTIPIIPLFHHSIPP